MATSSCYALVAFIYDVFAHCFIRFLLQVAHRHSLLLAFISDLRVGLGCDLGL